MRGPRKSARALTVAIKAARERDRRVTPANPQAGRERRVAGGSGACSIRKHHGHRSTPATARSRAERRAANHLSMLPRARGGQTSADRVAERRRCRSIGRAIGVANIARRARTCGASPFQVIPRRIMKPRRDCFDADSKRLRHRTSRSATADGEKRRVLMASKPAFMAAEQWASDGVSARSRPVFGAACGFA